MRDEVVARIQWKQPTPAAVWDCFEGYERCTFAPQCSGTSAGAVGWLFFTDLACGRRMAAEQLFPPPGLAAFHLKDDHARPAVRLVPCWGGGGCTLSPTVLLANDNALCWGANRDGTGGGHSN